MRMLLLDEQGFPRLELADPTAANEPDFEIVAIKVLSRLYPSCYVFPFKPIVQHDGVGWRPDVALVDKEFAYWFVIEIETVNHSLQKHVLPQVRAFRDGDYGREAAERLSENLSMTVPQAETFLSHIPRYVVVVSNHDQKEWKERLRAENIQHISIETFSRQNGSSAILVGELLKVAERSLGFGTVFASLQAIRIPASKFWRPGTYSILTTDGSIADWDCSEEGKLVWITKKRGLITAPDKMIVQFILQDEGRILLRDLPC
jgi:hypothetical protein